MKSKNRIVLGAALLLALAGTLVPATAEAQQRGRRDYNYRNNRGGWYTPPGTNIQMWPAPRYNYRINGMDIYSRRPLRIYNLDNNSWPYGRPRGYNWPYNRGYSQQRDNVYREYRVRPRGY